MPEFRRGWARWLPREAERDLFHPSLEDLRAELAPGWRLRVATAALWLDCWRVWVSARHRVLPADRRRRSLGGQRAGHHRSRISPGDLRAMLMQDVRRALRLFRMEPGFAAAAVFTLALGIGANTALFAVVEAVLLRPLPVTGADELVILKHRDLGTGITKEFVGIGDVIDLRARQRSLEPLAAYGAFQNILYGDAEPLRVEGLGVTPEWLAALRVRPAMGRLLDAYDMRSDTAPVAMISHELWRTQFGSDPRILSRSLLLGRTRRQIVGVLPQGFHFPPDSPTDLLLPMSLPPTAPAQRSSGWILALGRLRPGQTIETAQAEFTTLSAELERQFPRQNRGIQYYVEPLRDALIGETKRPLLLLLAAVGLLLLIACANVGNLLLARALGRRQEMAVRTALGATWTRLASQVLVEGLVLALVGGALGVLTAWQAAPVLAALVPETTRVPALHDVGLNLPVLAFSFIASVGAALLFSLVACLSLLNHERRSALADTRGTTMSVRSRRAASLLVVGEIALAGILLVGAGLTLRSVANLIAVDPGFRIDNVLTLDVTVPVARYPNAAARDDFYSRAFATLDALPGVERSGAAVVMPLTGNNWTVPFERADRPVPAGERPPNVGWQAATGGYFAALGIPLVAGRVFEDRDAAAPVPPVIISAEIARQYFPDEDAVGRRLRLGTDQLEIIGVVGDIRRAALTDRPRADMYFRFSDARATLFVRTAGDPLPALPAIRAALRSLEPNVMVHGARTMAEVASASTAIAQLAMRLLAGFAAAALALAAIGIYGVMAYSVRRRTREIGTRVALGASRADIVRLVMREGAAITLAGVATGLSGGLLAARSLTAVLYDVPPADPWSLVAAAALLSTAAMSACYLPARRAARVDPARTLTE